MEVNSVVSFSSPISSVLRAQQAPIAAQAESQTKANGHHDATPHDKPSSSSATLGTRVNTTA